MPIFKGSVWSIVLHGVMTVALLGCKAAQYNRANLNVAWLCLQCNVKLQANNINTECKCLLKRTRLNIAFLSKQHKNKRA